VTSVTHVQKKTTGASEEPSHCRGASRSMFGKSSYSERGVDRAKADDAGCHEHRGDDEQDDGGDAGYDAEEIQRCHCNCKQHADYAVNAAEIF
jgi:hypothetical protein